MIRQLRLRGSGPIRLAKVLAIWVGLLCLTSCGRQASPVVRLPSGKSIQIIQVKNLYFESGEKAFYLSYIANAPLSDIEQMNAEEEEVWQKFETEADKREMVTAIIAPTKVVAVGFLSKSNSYNYVYRKVNGTWILTNKPK